MVIKVRGVVDVDAERAYWKDVGGVPGYPYSSNWSLLVGIAASVFVASPYGSMSEWVSAVRAKLQTRGDFIPDAEVEAIVQACLARLDAVPEHGALIG